MNTNLTTDELSARALERLKTPPPAGSGVHQWLFATACLLTESGYSTAAKNDMLYQASRRVGRTVSQREIKSAITAAEHKTPIQISPKQNEEFVKSETAWPSPDIQHVYLLGKSAQGYMTSWNAPHCGSMTRRIIVSKRSMSYFLATRCSASVNPVPSSQHDDATCGAAISQTMRSSSRTRCCRFSGSLKKGKERACEDECRPQVLPRYRVRHCALCARFQNPNHLDTGH